MKSKVLVCLLLVMAAGVCHAATVDLVCTKDTYVNANAPDSPFGNDSQLYMGAARFTYVAFSTIPLNSIALDDIQSATLKMYTPLAWTNATTGPVERPRFSWDENLTYNTQGTDFQFVTTWSDDWADQDNGQYNFEVDLTDLVKFWKTGAVVNHGLRLRTYSSNTGAAIFDPTEESTRGLPPVIEVSYVPEPMTIGLLGAGLAFIRRRK
jgi:hypothetical protein